MNKTNALLSIAVINTMYVLMLFGSYYIHENIGDNGFWMTLIIGVFGVICGWTIGTLSSPRDAGEAQAFKKYAGVIAGFATGYLFTKIEIVIMDISINLLVNPVYGLRVLIFSSCLMSGVLIMYILRAYLHDKKSVGKDILPRQNKHD